MSNQSKPRVVKDYDNLETEIQDGIRLEYPYGFDKYIITFKNIKGKFVSALPFETEEKHYLIRMTRAEAQEIIEEDDAYDDAGKLKLSVKEELTEKYDDSETKKIELPDEESDDDDFSN